MKIKTTLLFSILILTFFLNCSNNETGLENNITTSTHKLEINGEVQSIANTNPTILSNLNSIQAGEEGYGLSLTLILQDDTIVTLIFYNYDANAENVNLGNYTTDLDLALTSTECKYLYASVLDSDKKIFNSVDDTYSNDIIKLIKCDKTNKKASAEYEVTLTKLINDETIHLKGSFTDESIIVSN